MHCEYIGLPLRLNSSNGSAPITIQCILHSVSIDKASVFAGRMVDVVSQTVVVNHLANFRKICSFNVNKRFRQFPFEVVVCNCICLETTLFEAYHIFLSIYILFLFFFVCIHFGWLCRVCICISNLMNSVQ